jgi:GNAT superfamily N-acetyltransferase
MPLRIEYLVDHRDLVPVVAEWHWKDDGERTPLDFWVRAHSEESQGTKVPSCSVAFLHGRPVGCVSLIERNMDTHPELSPWLAALFVVPEVQGRGIGSTLTQHCEDRAAELGHSLLYLYAEDAEGFYARLGWWHVRAVEQYEGSAVSRMHKRVGPPP